MLFTRELWVGQWKPINQFSAGQNGRAQLLAELTFTFWGREKVNIISKSFQSSLACDYGRMAETCFAEEKT